MPKPTINQSFLQDEGFILDLTESADNFNDLLDRGQAHMFEAIPTGIKFLDDQIGGGYRGGKLIMFSGAQNTGKSAINLQQGICLAEQGAMVIYVCYEHSKKELYERILTQISFNNLDNESFHLTDLLNVSRDVALEEKDSNESTQPKRKLASIEKVISRLPGGKYGWARISSIQNRIWLINGDPNSTTVDHLEKIVLEASQSYKKIVLFIDSVQLVPVHQRGNNSMTDDEKIAKVVNGLKNLSLRFLDKGFMVPVIAISEVEKSALKKGRVNFEDLKGDQTLPFRPDIGFMLNKIPKFYQPEKYKESIPYIEFSIQKSRDGRSDQTWNIPFYGATYSFIFELAEFIDFDKSQQKERYAKQ